MLAQVFDFVVQAMTAAVNVGRGLVEGWNLIKPAAAMLWNALAQLGSKLGETIALLSGNSTAAKGNGDAWTSLGVVIAFAISMIIGAIALFVSLVSTGAAIVNGIIGGVMSVFSGLADVITGVVFIIGGIFTGSWNDIWTGMKLIAFGVIDAIVGVVLELVGVLAGAADAMAGLVGKTTHLQASVQGFTDKVHGDMATSFGVQNLTFTPVKPAGGIGPAATPTAGTAMPAVAAVGATPSTPIGPVYGPPPPPAPFTVNLQVDGQTLATAVHKANADGAARSFSPVPAL